MTIKYRYTQTGEVHEGELLRTADMTGSHEVVRSVVQQIANETGEMVLFSMLDPTGTAVVGTDHAEPQDVENTQHRTVESLDISEDGGASWHSLHVRN
jgi:hypothetical protein